MSGRREDFFGPHETYLGIDVGKSFHWAIGLDQSGEIVICRRLENRQADVDALLDEAGGGTLVVVDQKNNIGSLVVRRCRARGVDVGYMPGKTMKKARDMLPGTAKTDRIDAEVIALTAMGMRHVVLPIAETDGLGAELAGDETYDCLPTIPGAGAKTATPLVSMVDISLFASDDKLASYCGLAPADSRSGTSIDNSSSSRAGNRQLKNLLIFSCNSLVGTKNRFGRYYEKCRASNMPHNKALKAVARKRLGIIFAIMRDRVPYVEPLAEDVEKPVPAA